MVGAGRGPRGPRRRDFSVLRPQRGRQPAAGGRLPPGYGGRVAQALRRGLQKLQEDLAKVQPKTPKEAALHRIATIHLQEEIDRLNAGATNTTFFRYKDENGRACLTWCWGYQPTASAPGTTVVCPSPECRLLARLGPEPTYTCLRCGTELRRKRRSGAWLALIAGLLLVLIAVGLAALALYWPTIRGRQPDDTATARAEETPPVQPKTSADQHGQETPGTADKKKAKPAASKDTAALEGTVVNAASKAPISAAKIVLTGHSEEAETDATGRFRLEGLSPGKAEFEVTSPGYAPERVTRELKDAGETGVEVPLKGAGVVAGMLVNAASKAPVSAAKIALAGTSQHVESDKFGRFRLEGLSPGKAEFEVAAPGYVSQRVTKALKETGETSVEVQLQTTRVLAGLVLDAVSKTPIARAKIFLAGRSQAAEADAAGRFRLEGLSPGKAEFEVAAGGYVPQRATQELKATGETSVEVLLQGAAVLTGTVVDAASKKPIAAALVRTRWGGKAKTDAQGKFRIEGLKSGPADIHVAADGYVSQRLTEELAAGKETAIPIELRQPPPEPVAVKPAEKPAEKPAKPVEKLAKPAEKPVRPALRPSKSVVLPARPVVRPSRPGVTFFGIMSKGDAVGFAVDCSGSMEGNRIARAKAELFDAIMRLESRQAFYITFFNGLPVPMSEEPRTPFQALPLEKVRAYKWLKTVAASDGTQPQSSVEMLAKMKLPVIFLLSDGGFPPLDSGAYRLLKENAITVNTVAFEDPTGTERLREIAAKTGGTFRFIEASSAPPPPEAMFGTRLVRWLIDGLRAPPPSDPQQYREALEELCEGQDFGPQPGASPADVKRAADAWFAWWAENQILPNLKDFRIEDLVAALECPIAAVRQGAHDALVACNGVDYGPAADASPAERAASVAKWKDWFKRKEDAERLAAEEKKRAAERERIEQQQKEAAGKLHLVNQLFKAYSVGGALPEKESRDLLKRRFQEVIDKFPGTDAAQEAQQRLEQPELQDPKPAKPGKAGR